LTAAVSGPSGVRRLSLVPVAWLKPHEQFVEERVREVLENFRKAGAIDFAIVADARTGTVIDGHHRLEALRRLHAVLAPAFLVDYMDASVTVRNWREHEAPVTKEDVLRHASEGKLFPPKTTRHDFVRVLDPVDVPLAELADERTPRGF
jgi:ParB-like chromosome segregation protein Spo0J